MTYHITEDAVSSLKDGIETIVVPIRDKHDLEHLVFHTQRGGVYDVVEWLLSELGRPMEMERVCGLSVTPQGDQVTVNLELRQPGKQLEEWFTEGWDKIHLSRLKEDGVYRGFHASLSQVTGEDEAPVGKSGWLSERSVSQEKFTDNHKPWWEDYARDLPQVMMEVETGEHKTTVAEGRRRTD